MAKKFAELTEKQHAAFRAKCEQVGLTADHLAACQTACDKPGPRIISTRPERGNVPLITRQVPDVRTLKKIGGFPDADYTSGKYSDAAITYPAPLGSQATKLVAECAGDRCRLEAECGSAVLEDVNVAMRAFVLGNSQKVEAYEPLINALHFPMETAAAGGEVINITADSPLIIDNPDGPVELVYAVMNIFDGGFIEVLTPAQIDSQFVSNEL